MEVLETAKRILNTTDHGLCALACEFGHEQPIVIQWIENALRAGAIPRLVYDFALHVIEQHEGDGNPLFI